MKTLIIFFLAIVSFESFAQESEERILYVVDSIIVVDDPEEDEGELNGMDIETLTVITNKADIAKYGYKDVDKVIFIITKEYVRRSDEVKRIPTTKNMERRDGRWYLRKSTVPYSGQFIDYFFSGRRQGDGTMKGGLLDGKRSVYYQNGNLSYYTTYSAGVETGESKEYFINGALHQEGNFKNGKDDGLWKEWYSTGILKRQTEFKEGNVVGATKEQERFHQALSSGITMFGEENYGRAIESYNKAIALNPNYSDAYFHRGTAYLYDFRFDEAVKDFDRAIELEPLYMEAISNRAFARLRKYEFKNSRTLRKSNGVTILAAKDNVEIPKEELEKICADLTKAVELGETSPMVLDVMKRYCK